jgi:hypothetical protein
MKFSQTQKLIFALVIFAIAGFIIYSSFFSGSGLGGVVSSDDTATTTDTGQDIVNMASEMDNISINSQLFSLPIFVNLVDFDVPPSPVAQGRPNPFAPIGNDTGVQTVAATSSPKSTK